MNRIQYKDHSYIGYCVYFLIDKKTIVYVGCTCNLAKRLGEHVQWAPLTKLGRKALISPVGKIRSIDRYDFKFGLYYDKSLRWRLGLCKKVFTHYSYIPVKDRHAALKLESNNIKKYKPKYNSNKNYQWIPRSKINMLKEGLEHPQYYYLLQLVKKYV